VVGCKQKRRTAPVIIGKDGSDRIAIAVRTYTAKYRDGKWHVQEVATGCRDEQAARAILSELETRAMRVKAKILTPAEDAVIDHQATSLAEHLKAYDDHLEALGNSAEYRDNTLRQLRRIAAECEFAQLADLNSETVERWLVAKSKQNVGARTRNSYRADAVGFCNWCVANGRLISNPFAGLPKANEVVDCRRKRRALSEAELIKLLDIARRRPLLDARTVRRGKHKGQAVAKLRPEVVERLELLGQERALIYKTLVLTGLRRGELASLSIGQLHLDGGRPHAELYAADEKNREGSQIPLRRDLADDLIAWIGLLTKRNTCKPDANERQFCLPLTGVPQLAALPADIPLFNVPVKLVKILDRDLKLAGIPKRDERGRTVDVHALRHSFGTMLSRSGVAPRTAQAAMRHSTIDLTMNVYTDPKLLDIHQAVESLPRLDLASPQEQNQHRATGTFDASSQFAPAFAPTIDNSGESLASAVISADPSEPSRAHARVRVSVDSVKRNNPLSMSDNGSQGGWLTGLEPVTPRSTIWCSNQLSYSHRE
jgi:integrase